MPDRMRAEDMALLAAETPRAPRQVSVVLVLDPGPDGFDSERLQRLIDDRIALVPRYRQRVQPVIGGLAPPAWVDDEHFDLSYHVRRSALPRPGTMAQLRDLVARLVARPLDRERPLWEIYLVEGLERGQVAVVLKTHEALVDGTETVALGQIILDETPEPPELPADHWVPMAAPSQLSLAAESVFHLIRNPQRLPRLALTMAQAVSDTAERLGDAVGLPTAGPVPTSPLSRQLSRQRRFVTVASGLDDHRAVRDTHGGTVNDVVLSAVTGALRAWLLTRGERIPPESTVRAMVPLSVRDGAAEPTSLGSQVAGHLLALPVGEADPVMRLHQVSYALKAHKETGMAVAASRLASLPGFASTTFHLLGARVADSQAGLPYQLVVTNVPGPQEPVYAAGARLVATYPVLPLREHRALAIGVTSYDGAVFYGINADRDAIGDAELLGQCLADAIEELVDTTRDRSRAPRGRADPDVTVAPAVKKPPAKKPAAKKPAAKKPPAKKPAAKKPVAKTAAAKTAAAKKPAAKTAAAKKPAAKKTVAQKKASAKKAPAATKSPS